MAVSFTAERKNASGLAAGATFTLQPATNCTTGSTLYLCVGERLLDLVVTSVTDDVGTNTYNIDLTVADGAKSAASIISSFQTVGLTTANTITVTLSSTGGQWSAWLEEFGGGNYSALDKKTTSTGSASTTLPTGTTAATTDADEAAIVLYGTDGTGTITKNASYTVFTTGLTNRCLAAYRILTATGTQNADGTDSGMANSANGLATYKIIAAAAFVAPAEKVILQAVNRAATF